MTPAEYIEKSGVTDVPTYAAILVRLQDEKTVRLLHAVMGIVTEAGEMMDELKRHIIYGKPIDEINLQEEVGDSFWYHALALRTLMKTIEGTMDQNIAKLAKRYPEKFTEHAALNRDLYVERAALEDYS